MKIKNHIFLAVILVSIGLMVTNTTSSVNITPTTYDDEEIVSVLVYLKDRVDLDSITNQMDRQRASLRERHETVVLTLQNTASSTQTNLVEHLDDLQSKELVEDYQCFWVDNIIRVDAYQSVVNKISKRDDVLKVYPNYRIELIEPVEQGIEGEQNYRNSPEPGIEAIRVTKSEQYHLIFSIMPTPSTMRAKGQPIPMICRLISTQTGNMVTSSKKTK